MLCVTDAFLWQQMQRVSAEVPCQKVTRLQIVIDTQCYFKKDNSYSLHVYILLNRDHGVVFINIPLDVSTA